MTEQRATSDGRSAMWAIIGVLVGAFLPIFLCVCLIATTVVGLGASLGSAGPSPEIVAGAGPIRARHLSGPLTGPAVAVISVNGPIVSGEGVQLRLGRHTSRGWPQPRSRAWSRPQRRTAM
jgi:hypothetical protein